MKFELVFIIFFSSYVNLILQKVKKENFLVLASCRRGHQRNTSLHIIDTLVVYAKDLASVKSRKILLCFKYILLIPCWILSFHVYLWTVIFNYNGKLCINETRIHGRFIVLLRMIRNNSINLIAWFIKFLVNTLKGPMI